MQEEGAGWGFQGSDHQQGGGEPAGDSKWKDSSVTISDSMEKENG